MRSGPSTKNSIVRMLRSGTPVEIVEQDADLGYTLVRLRSGTEGWVLTRYLMKEEAARNRLAVVDQEAQEAKSKWQQLEAELNGIKKKMADLDAERDLLEAENARLKLELEDIREASSNALAIKDENRRLQERLATTDKEFTVQREENERLLSRANRDWFIAGAGVLGLGVLLGLILPRMRWRRRSEWSDF